jgi:hypothetical protein
MIHRHHCFRVRWRLDRLQGDVLATVVAVRVDILGRRHVVENLAECRDEGRCLGLAHTTRLARGGLSSGRPEIDPKHLRQSEDVAAGMAVPFGELGDELLDAGVGDGDDLFRVTLPKRDFFTERAFERRPEVRHKR